MVFCYKDVTIPPPPPSGYSRIGSPKRSFRDASYKSDLFSNVTDDISIPKYKRAPTTEDLLQEISTKDWKILSLLAQKRDKDEENRRLADRCHQLWNKEQKQRRQLDKVIAQEYKNYIIQKRQKEREEMESRRLQKEAEEKFARASLMSFIKEKERLSQEKMDQKNEMKMTSILAQMVNDEIRFMKVAERRGRQLLAEELQRKLEVYEVEKKLEDARRRKVDMLRNLARRTAIANAINQSLAAVILQEETDKYLAQQAICASRVALTEAKSAQLARARELKALRARRLADLTFQLREMIKNS